MFRRGRRRFESQMRSMRPTPRREFVDELVAKMTPVRHRGRGLGARVAFSGGLTALLLVGVGALGGISYAASAAQQAVHVVKKAFAPTGSQSAITVRGLTAGGDEYQSGFGWGDKNHNHDGPPGVKHGGKNQQNGQFAPPLQATSTDGGLAKLVKTSITLDEQAHLFISVVDKTGKQLLLTQKSAKGGSTVGKGLTGAQTKTIQYEVLVPRTIPLNLRVPANLLKSSKTYRIRVIARDPQGNKTTTYLPFQA